MQDRYTGDIGDYVKYGILRALSDQARLGVAWYLFPDEDHNEDGRHISYLKKQHQWRGFDPELFDVVRKIVADDQRHVGAVESSRILGPAVFSGELLDGQDMSPPRRRAWRAGWFDRVQASLTGCDIVFADPDNGLCEDEKFRPGRVKDWKRLPLSEARSLARDRTAVIYHHNTRRAGGHEKEIAYWIAQLGVGTIALRWRAYSSRTFFVINPTPSMTERLKLFADAWGPKADFYD